MLGSMLERVARGIPLNTCACQLARKCLPLSGLERPEIENKELSLIKHGIFNMIKWYDNT